MLTTTLRLLRDHYACQSRYDHLVAALGDGWGDDAVIPVERILDTNGLDDALLALRATAPAQDAERDRLARLFACDCAEAVLPHWLAVYPADDRPAAAIRAARAYALAPSDDASYASDAARAARYAARDAARDAASAASYASYASLAARDASYAASDASLAASDAARDAQTALLRAYLRGEK